MCASHSYRFPTWIPVHGHEVGRGRGDGATASVGVGVATSGLGEGVASSGVTVGTAGGAVGCARRCGGGKKVRIVPQIMLTTTRALSTTNKFAPRPLDERLTSYLPNLLPFTAPEALQSRLSIRINLQGAF